MLWNFAANIFCAFVHLFPMFPEECIRFDSHLSFADSEIYRHILFMALIICILNGTVAISAVFVHRYVVFDDIAPKRKITMRIWLASVHIGTTTATAIIYKRWMLYISSYPNKEQIDMNYAICFKPDGWEKVAAVSGVLLAGTLALMIVIISTHLLLRSFNRRKADISSQIIGKHRRILRILLIISSVPLFFGVLPSTLIIACFLDPYLSYANEVTLVSVVVFANHGSIYSVVMIVAIKPYRKAAWDFLSRVFCLKQNPQSVNVRVV
uniref:G_PROTEIN_RECEP_F1_2 domain-containing protein n=1 Tax=Steinernema glaseri TaxID=37863 RepID=A0A1I8A033_9BILA